MTPRLNPDQVFVGSVSRNSAGLQTLVGNALEANLERGFLESEERFTQIAEALRDIVALTSLNGEDVFYVNEAYERIWGRSRAELYANPLAYLEGVHPDDRDRVRDTLTRIHRTACMDESCENDGCDMEFRVVRPDATQRWLWYRCFPVRDADGNVYRIASITEDITERRQIIQSHKRLIRGFTHDVKNPLGAADGYLSLLELGIFGEMAEQQTAHLGRARRCIRIALDLVTQLLDIERTEAGEPRIERARMNLGVVASDAIEVFRAAAEAKRHRLDLLTADTLDSLYLDSDSARVRQIVANLLSNAVKYTQPGGRISVRAYVASDGDAPRPGRWMAIAVADNGPGIASEKQAMVFREFTRLDAAATQGSGIGLAISQRLATALGAAITLVSAPGAGSTFTLWLPADPLRARST